MIIKRKSLVVGLISSVVIALALIMTLVGYSGYLEFKNIEFERVYQELLEEAKAKVYSKHLDIFGLDARIESAGALKGKPILEGAVTNKGTRNVVKLILKLSFLDKDSAVIYEFTARPQEPSLQHMHTRTHLTDAIKPGETLKFKKILTDCPTEIFVELREGEKPAKSFGRWSGKLTSKVVSLDLL